MICLLLFAGWSVIACSTVPQPAEDLALSGSGDTAIDTPAESASSSRSYGAARRPETVSGTRNAPLHSRQALLDEALDACQTAQEYWQNGDLDSALEALDRAYALILQADGDIDPKLMQQKEDLRFTIAKRILEIHASRHIVVSGQHQAIPMVRNRHVDAEIERLTGPERGFFIRSLQRSGRYRTMIVAALREAGLPEALSWLPLIESGFRVDALSPARALGLWQFIPSTGHKFGLQRDTYIDERLDPHKSTAAAVAYLTELHSIFGDWTTVLAAYNCGEGRVLRTIRSQNINYLDNFWDLYERLPNETARYVPRFLATLHILENPARYGMEEIQPDAPPVFETVEVTRRVTLKDVAAALQIDEQELHLLNPELRHRIVPADGYLLKVPGGRSETLTAVLDQLPESTIEARPESAGVVLHQVKRGETLTTIARQHRTSVSAIMRANHLRRSNHIQAGMALKIPTRAGAAAPKAEPADKVQRTAAAKPATVSPARAVRHTVKSGDSLWNIAQRYDTTVQKIQTANKLSGARLSIGQTLVIPARGEPLAAARQKTYKVKKGDTPLMIANRHKIPLERLLRLNRLSPRCTIYPGQQLFVE
jgi:membrane-bound lytic murein transglycosylase D